MLSEFSDVLVMEIFIQNENPPSMLSTCQWGGEGLLGLANAGSLKSGYGTPRFPSTNTANNDVT